jgi:hypothetical protein
MIKYEHEKETHIEILHKNMKEDSFVQIDHYILPDQYKNIELTLLSEGRDKVFYDHFDSKYQVFDIMEFYNGSHRVLYENALNLRCISNQGAVVYYDVIKDKYIAINRSLDLNIESNKPLFTINEKFVEMEYDGTDYMFDISTDIYNDGIKTTYTEELNIGKDIIIKADLFYNVLRVETIHITELGGLELKVYEKKLKSK